MLNDADLLKLICKGDQRAFADLVKKHTQNYFALAYRTLQNKSDAEDVVQSAFIKLWQKPTAWNAEKSAFTTWFYRVVLNACHDHIRRVQRDRLVDVPAIETLMQPVVSEQTTLEQRQQVEWQQECLEKAIAELPTAQRDALNLVVYAEMPQKQAAEVLGVSVKALESQLHRAKRALALSVEKFEQSNSEQSNLHCA